MGNCYDKEIFNKIVHELARKRTAELQPGDRPRILAAVKAVKYESAEDQEFLDFLAQKEKSQRYEAACVEQRMIVGNSQSGMHAPEGYLRSLIVGTNNKGDKVKRPHGLVS